MASYFNYVIHTDKIDKANEYIKFGQKLWDLTTKYADDPGYCTCNKHISGQILSISGNEFYELMKEFNLINGVDFETEQ